MIAVVTGSSGFIGTHLVDALVRRGDEVRVLLRPDSSRTAPRNPGAAVFEADLLDDRSVRESPVWEGAGEVYHLAGITKARTMAQFRAGNVFPTANVLAALAARGAPAPRIVLVSSQSAAGPASGPETPVREQDRPVPVEAYGRSKLQAEQAVTRYRDQLPVTIVRPASVYGPGDRDFLQAFKQSSGRIAVLAVPREHHLSLVYVGDLVSALLLAAERPEAAGRTYFVAGDSVTWGALYDEIARAAGSHPREVQLPLTALRVAARAADLVGALSGRTLLLNRHKAALARPRWWVCDAARLREELGWEPRVTLEEGVRETYRWYVEQGWLSAPGHPPAGTATELRA